MSRADKVSQVKYISIIYSNLNGIIDGLRYPKGDIWSGFVCPSFTLYSNPPDGDGTAEVHSGDAKLWVTDSSGRVPAQLMKRQILLFPFCVCRRLWEHF